VTDYAIGPIGARGLPERSARGARVRGSLAAITPAQWLLAALLVGGAAIHLSMAPSHLAESGIMGGGFVAAAWVQLALAGAVLMRPAKWVYRATMVVSFAFVVVWAISRTAGLPLSGHAGDVEDVAFVDGVTVVLEGAAIVLAGALLLRPAVRVTSRAVAAVGAVAALAFTTAAIASPSARDHIAGGAGHTHGAEATATVPGQPVALNGQHVHGVKAQDIAAESAANVPLDPATRETLKAQLTAAREVALRFPTVASATAAGYRVAGGFAPGSGAHYVGGNGGFQLTGNGSFDPSAPMSLIYDGVSPDSQIVGLMYYAMGSAPEGFAGPNDHWHRHSNVCVKYAATGIDVPFPADAEVTKAQCDAAGGSYMNVTGWMVHAWVVPSWESPQGVFSHDNPDVRCADGTYETDKAGFCRGT
jgi:hypothetical protein